MKRLKVLLSAYACEPDQGSEPGVGWNWVKQIARFHEVWVITRANNREPIERALTQEPLSNVHVVYFDLPRWAWFWKKRQRGIHLYYYLWQIGGYFTGKRLHREVSFDLAHHLTFVIYWIPSFLAFLPIPFVWGPVGGGESAPKVFLRVLSLRGRVYERQRALAHWLGEHDPFVRLTARRARLAVATTPETAEQLKRLGCQQVTVFSQVAMATDEITRLQSLHPRNTDPFRVMSIGRLLHWKGFHLGLTAFARLQQIFPASEYWFIGDGPERRNLEGLVHEFNVAAKVQFLGNLPRQQVLAKLAECDVLVHPSLHDSGGWVCMEAMAAGRPVLCLDLGGPALQVTEETGFKVPALSPEQVVTDLAEALRRLAQDPVLRARLGKAARARVVEYFGWDKKGEWIREVYGEVVVR